MKKFMKKLCSLVILLGVMASCIPFNSYAAEGSLQFSDPTCAAGENVEINVKVLSPVGNIGDYEINIAYDTAMLKFVSGDNATGGDGVVTLSHSGDGGAETLHVLSFTALDNGSTTVSVNSYNAALTYGEELNLSLGEGVVSIEGGTPVKDSEEASNNTDGASHEAGSALEVVYNEEKYYIFEDFSDKEIPEGFEKISLDYNGSSINAFKHSKSGQIVLYGESEDGENTYLFEDQSTKKLIPAVLAPINSTLSIMVMDAPEGEKMPDHIMPTTMTLNGKKFNIYNNIDNQDFYYIYAFSTEGTLGYYEYDAVEKTYQRANELDFVVEEEVVEETNPLMDFVENYLYILIIAIAALVVILITVIIILSVKLSKRGKGNNYSEEIADDVNDYDENDVYDVEFDDYDDGEDNKIDVESKEAMDDFFDDMDFEFDDDELVIEEDAPVKKNKGRNKKKSKDKDDFSIDFIEL